MVVKRLTLDMTAIRDAAAYEDREHHRDALVLLELAERGDVELGVPPQGSLADLGGQFGGELAERVQGLLARPGIVGLPELPGSRTSPSRARTYCRALMSMASMKHGGMRSLRIWN